MAKGRKRASVPPPYPLAMVVADAIWRDPATNKRTILGCFSTIGARSFPTVHPQLAVYVALTDGRGRVPIKLQMVHVDDDSNPIFQAEGEVEFPDPRVVLEMDFGFGNIVIPEPAEYRIQLLVSNDLVLERRIIVQRINGEQQ